MSSIALYSHTGITNCLYVWVQRKIECRYPAQSCLWEAVARLCVVQFLPDLIPLQCIGSSPEILPHKKINRFAGVCASVVCSELKRLSTVTLSPIYSHFSETLAGLSTVRAMRAVFRFATENERRLDISQRANFVGEQEMNRIASSHLRSCKKSRLCENATLIKPAFVVISLSGFELMEHLTWNCFVGCIVLGQLTLH